MAKQNQYAVYTRPITKDILYIEYSPRTDNLVTVMKSGKRTFNPLTVDNGKTIFNRMVDNGIIKLITYAEAKQLLAKSILKAHNSEWIEITKEQAEQIVKDAETPKADKISYYKFNSSSMNRWYVTFNHTTKKITCISKDNTTDITDSYNYSNIEYYVKHGVWREISEHDAEQMNKSYNTPKVVKPTKTYYKHVQNAFWHFVSYNHITKETIRYNKNGINSTVSNDWDFNFIQSCLDNLQWTEITRDEALNLLDI